MSNALVSRIDSDVNYRPSALTYTAHMLFAPRREMWRSPSLYCTKTYFNGKMMFLNVLLLWVCVGSTVGFMCYTCSYGGVDLQKRSFSCLNLQSYVDSVRCGNFCVTQEQFDKQTGMMASFLRTCSVDWGNKCLEDDFSIICKTSCTGDYCNAGVNPDPESKVKPTVYPEYHGSGGTSSNCDRTHIVTLFVLLAVVSKVSGLV